MAKKDSLLGSIIKGTVDLTASTIKTAYDAAEEIAKVGYEVATSKQAKEIYKKTGSVVGDLLRFTPPKDKISKEKLVNYLTVEEEHIKDTYNSLLKNHIKQKPSKKLYENFKLHWRAICAQIVFGALAKTRDNSSYIEMREYLINELDKKDSQIMQLVKHGYSQAYARGGSEIPRILNNQCFDGEMSESAIDEFDRGFAMIHEAMIQGLKI